MDFTKLQNLLDEQMQWPSHYLFKFVIKSEHKHKALAVLAPHETTEKPSRNGNYTSISANILVNSSDEVIQVYQKMSKIEGIITL